MSTCSPSASKRERRPGPIARIWEWRGSCALSREWLSRRHSLWTEALTVVVIYVAYEVSRGITVGDPSVALHHAHEVAHLEQSLSIFVEREVQVVAQAIPGLLGVLGVAYLALHLTVSIGCLVWVYRRHPTAFPILRNTLVLATAIAMIGYIAYPTAPPRLAGMGIVDTVSNGHVDLNTGLVHSLYNPFAAMPSMHFGYAVIIGISVVALSRHRAAQIAGVAYPAFVLFVIVATGNHFLLDAVAGGLVVGAAAVAHTGSPAAAHPSRTLQRRAGSRIPCNERTERPPTQLGGRT